MTTYNNLLTEIKDALAPFDAKYKQMMLDRYSDAYEAIVKSRTVEEAETAQERKEIEAGTFKPYGFGETPYNRHCRRINEILPRNAQKKLTDYGLEDKDVFLRFAEELANHNISARNSRVAKKLDNANIKEVNGGSIERTNDGFNGLFKVNTDSGEKKVKVQTILAWGDIQAPHYRTLIHIK